MKTVNMLTKRQKEVLDFVKKHISLKGYAPSLEEVTKHFKLSAISTAHHHIKTLVDGGYLLKNEYHPRAISIKNSQEGVTEIPLVGTIAAGQPIDAFQEVQQIEIPLALIPHTNKTYFALKVKGDSMIDDGILDGDTIIAEKTNAANDGDLVVALADNNEATLKYFYRERNRIRLEPRNPVYDPIFLNSVQIQGKFVNLIRKTQQQPQVVPGDTTLEREKLEKQYTPIFKKQFEFRKLVTYVPNKKLPIFNWFPYKEGFSRDLILKILTEFHIAQGSNILDPFGGCGTTVLTCKQNGYNSTAVDILPIAVFVATVKLRNRADYNLEKLEIAIQNLLNVQYKEPKSKLPDIPIIHKAFPANTQKELLFFKEEILKVEDSKIRDFLLLGLLSMLVEVSFTSKDGQYLRLVEKTIPPVNTVLKRKLDTMFLDLRGGNIQEQSSLFENNSKAQLNGQSKVMLGDARKLDLPSNTFDAVITSPPYLNRYDYSRIYALELGLNFVKDAADLKKIRHSLLKSHIEVRPAQTDDVKVPALVEILENLNKKDLNNPRIPIMIKGYFEDMKLVIEEMYRVCKKKAVVALVVGNVRFEGEIVPVDLILSEIAKNVGFETIGVWATRYKGNSSQQMGKYGRTPVRESIILWKKS